MAFSLAILPLNITGMFFGADDFGEDDDEDSEDEIGCAKEVLGNQSESELNFEDF